MLRICPPLASLATGGSKVSSIAAGFRFWEPRHVGKNLGEKTGVEKTGAEKT